MCLTSMNEGENIFLPDRKANSLGRLCFTDFNTKKHFYPNLDRLPLHVRMKLDLTGIKLSLKQWLAFHIEERTAICHLPVDHEDEKQVFKDYLNFLSRQYCGRPGARAPAHGTLVGNLGSSSGTGSGTIRRQRQGCYTRRVDRLGVSSTLCLVQNSCLEKRTREVFRGSR